MSRDKRHNTGKSAVLAASGETFETIEEQRRRLFDQASAKPRNVLRLLPSRPSRKGYQYLLSDVTLPRLRQ